MSLINLLGYLFLAFPFIVLFIFILRNAGWEAVKFVFGIWFLVVFILWAGVEMITR